MPPPDARTRREPRIVPGALDKIATTTQHHHFTALPCSTTYNVDLIDEADARFDSIARRLAAGAWGDGLSSRECVSLLAMLDRAHRLVVLSIGGEQ